MGSSLTHKLASFILFLTEQTGFNISAHIAGKLKILETKLPKQIKEAEIAVTAKG